jgi:hypothetical protein
MPPESLCADREGDHRRRRNLLSPRAGAEGLSLARDLHDGADGMRNMTDMLALDVRPLAKQDLDVGCGAIGWPE